MKNKALKVSKGVIGLTLRAKPCQQGRLRGGGAGGGSCPPNVELAPLMAKNRPN